MTPAPPGWYPDPSGQAHLRWWDGGQWTPHTSPAPTMGYPPGAYAPYPPAGQAPYQPGFATAAPSRPRQPIDLAASRESSKRMSRWAIYGLRAWAVLQALNFILVGFSVRRSWKNLQHWMNQLRANPHGTQPPVPTTFAGLAAVVDAVGLLVIVAGLGFLIWQHSTAEVAREIGYPARRSPALGVGAWFIPVVNVWFPYQSLRDLLPPGHPARSRALMAWLLYLAGQVMAFTGLVLALVGSPVAPVPYVLGAACYVSVAVIGGQLIRTVNQEHGKALAERTSVDGAQVRSW